MKKNQTKTASMTEEAGNEVKIAEIIEVLVANGRYDLTKECTQHGTNTVYDHCVRVTNLSVRLAKKMNLRVDREELIRGALLHDYFLYDWHEKDKSHSWHGFTHPKTALQRAMEDYHLTEVEQDIIAHHMFPLTIVPPSHTEAWVVCLADKICAAQETIEPYAYKLRSKYA